MNLEREHETVNFYHYDKRNFDFEKANGTPETRINVQLQMLTERTDIAATDTAVQVSLSALIVLETFVLSASFSQVSVIKEQRIESRDQLSQENMQELASPLFDLLRRLTYEITEVALDEPGLKLEF
ncbi:MAG: DUF1149 family protein [Streptococcaceae bacterium]|jgi:hypothetical protein|nr:DUF1149 family protein [Streptococcaceae bacterium]